MSDNFLRYWDNVIIGLVAGLVVYYGIKIQNGLLAALFIFIFALLLTLIYSFFVWYDRKSLFKIKIKDWNKNIFGYLIIVAFLLLSLFSTNYIWNILGFIGKVLLILFTLVFLILLVVHFFYKKENSRKKLNTMINLVTLLVIVFLTVGVYISQIPKPLIDHNFYPDENNYLGIAFYNYGNKPSSLVNFTIIDFPTRSEHHYLPIFPILLNPYSDSYNYTSNITISGEIEKYGLIYYLETDSSLTKFEFIPSVNYSQNIKQIIGIHTSVSVSVIRHKDSSIINFEEKSLDNYETICYIENTGGNPEKYVIEDLNFSTPYIAPYEKYPFPCEIKNGKVIKYFKK